MATAPPANPQVQKLIKDIEECITELKQQYFTDIQEPITDDNTTLHRFCAKLEILLQTDQKGNIIDMFMNEWNELEPSVAEARSISQFKAELGRASLH